MRHLSIYMTARFAAVFFLISFSTLAWADEDCKDVNLNNVEPSFELVPTQDQGASPLQGVPNVAAQMIDFARRRQAVVQHKDVSDFVSSTSSVYAASVATKEITAGTLGADANTHASDVFNAVRKNGYCSDEEIAKVVKASAKGSGLSEAQMTANIETLCQKTATAAGTCESANGPEAQKQNLGEQLGKQASAQVMSKAVSCQKPVALDKLPEMENTQSGSDEDLKNLITQQFANSQPSSVRLCKEILDQPVSGSEVALNAQNKRSPAVKEGKSCAQQSVILTAQKAVNVNGKKECAYLVRNSFGTMWNGKKALSCDCRTGEDFKYTQSCKGQANNGYVGCWYKRSDILSQTLEVGTFKN